MDSRSEKENQASQVIQNRGRGNNPDGSINNDHHSSAPETECSNDDSDINDFSFNETDGMKIATSDDPFFYFKLLVTD